MVTHYSRVPQLCLWSIIVRMTPICVKHCTDCALNLCVSCRYSLQSLPSWWCLSVPPRQACLIVKGSTVHAYVTIARLGLTCQYMFLCQTSTSKVSFLHTWWVLPCPSYYARLGNVIYHYCGYCGDFNHYNSLYISTISSLDVWWPFRQLSTEHYNGWRSVYFTTPR